MTFEEWNRLSEQERNAKVAKLCGCYERKNSKGCYDLIVPGGIWQIDFVNEGDCWNAAPLYCQDLNLSLQLQQTVEEPEKEEEFSRLVDTQLDQTKPYSETGVLDYMWLGLNASANLRAWAFCEVIQ